MDDLDEQKLKELEETVNLFGKQTAANIFKLDIEQIDNIIKNDLNKTSIDNQRKTSMDNQRKTSSRSRYYHYSDELREHHSRTLSRERSFNSNRRSSPYERRYSTDRRRSRNRSRDRYTDRSRDRSRDRYTDRSPDDYRRSNGSHSPSRKRHRLSDNKIKSIEKDIDLATSSLESSRIREDNSKNNQQQISNLEITSYESPIDNQNLDAQIDYGNVESQIDNRNSESQIENQDVQNNEMEIDGNIYDIILSTDESIDDDSEGEINYVDDNFDDQIDLNKLKESGYSFILNSFKTLLKAKKHYLDTQDLVSIIQCNLVSTASDIYLHTNHSDHIDNRSIGKNCLNLKMFLSCTSKGIKFKPLFFINHLNLKNPLIKNDNIEHILDKKDWFDNVLKIEMNKNLIYSCICVSENTDFFLDNEFEDKFKSLNTDIIVMPNSISQFISPFQHSILLTLNGYLHKLYLNTRTFPTTLDTSLKAFEEAWNQLNQSDIVNAFNDLIKNCLDD